MGVWRWVLYRRLESDPRTVTGEEIMTKKISWPSFLFALYIVAVLVMGVVALSKIGPL